MNVQELINAAMQGADVHSVRQLAERMGVSHVAIGKWIAGDNYPSFEAAAELADMAGLPVIQTAAKIRQQAPEGTKYKHLLKKMSAIAADSEMLVGRPGFEPGTNRLKVLFIRIIWTSKRLCTMQYLINRSGMLSVLRRRQMSIAPNHLLA
jgi:transcriptional regulator with XRE-family HTH domain